MTSAQLEHIKKMETFLNQSQQLADELEKFLEKWKEISPKTEELIAYYQSKQWQKDYKASNENKIPKEIPHGVLSEDAVFNLLTQRQWLCEELISEFKKVI